MEEDKDINFEKINYEKTELIQSRRQGYRGGSSVLTLTGFIQPDKFYMVGKVKGKNLIVIREAEVKVASV